MALGYVGKGRDRMRRRHRDKERNQAQATTIGARRSGPPLPEDEFQSWISPVILHFLELVTDEDDRDAVVAQFVQ